MMQTSAATTAATTTTTATSEIKVELRQQATTLQYLFHDVDIGIAVVLAHKLLEHSDVVVFAAAREVHPLENTTELLLRIKTAKDTAESSRHIANQILHEVLSALSVAVVDPSRRQLRITTGGADVAEWKTPEGNCRPSKGELVLAKADHRWGNMVRRAMLTSVPTLAIEDVTLRKNTSVVPDAVLAERIRLLPLRCGDGRAPTAHDESACIALCSSSATDAVKTVTTVTSGELESSLGDVTVALSSGVHGGFPIVRLAPGQAVDLIVSSRVGTARRHARFAAVSTVGLFFTENGCHLPFRGKAQLSPSAIVELTFQAIASQLADLRAALIRCQ